MGERSTEREKALAIAVIAVGIFLWVTGKALMFGVLIAGLAGVVGIITANIVATIRSNVMVGKLSRAMENGNTSQVATFATASLYDEGIVVNMAFDKEVIIDSYIKERYVSLSEALIATAGAALFVVFLYSTGTLGMITLSGPWKDVSVEATIFMFTAGPVGIIIAIVGTLALDPKEKIRRRVGARLEVPPTKKKKYTIPELRELRERKQRIQSLLEPLSLHAPEDYDRECREYVAKHSFNSSYELEYLVSLYRAGCKRASEDESRLTRVTPLYCDAVDAVRRGKEAAERTGIKGLLADLDDLEDALCSNDLELLIKARHWDAFIEVVRDIKNEIYHITEAADLLQGSRSSYDDDEPDMSNDQMTTDRAYKILNIPPDTDPKKVRTMWQMLVTNWHPDKGKVSDPKKIQAINAAYRCLKETGLAE